MANPKTKKQINQAQPHASGEDFFRLPRAEFLVENIRRDASLNLGDLTRNSSITDSRHFPLQIENNDLQGAGIRAGDYLLIETGNPVYTEGDILAVQLGEHILFRRYFRAANRIRLECDPPSGQTIIVEADTPGFTILGRVVQIIREV